MHIFSEYVLGCRGRALAPGPHPPASALARALPPPHTPGISFLVAHTVQLPVVNFHLEVDGPLRWCQKGRAAVMLWPHTHIIHLTSPQHTGILSPHIITRRVENLNLELQGGGQDGGRIGGLVSSGPLNSARYLSNRSEHTRIQPEM